MTSSLTLSDYTSLTSETEGQDWACPRCTALNSSHNVNCQACIEGRNPHHGNTDNLKELVLEQEKWFSQATPKVERSITDRFKNFLGGWTCPVCKIDHRFGIKNSCTTCGHSLDPVKPVKPPKPKHSLKSQKSSSSTSIGSVFESLGSFFNGNKKPISVSDLSTDSHLYPSSSVDKHRHTGMVLVSKDEHGITDETISFELTQRGEDLLPHTQPTRPSSIDSGTCTMSDITSQTIHLEPSDSRYNSPISCTDLSKEAAWKCTVCSAFNRAVIGQLKCYVCNIGDAPRDIVPLLIQPNGYHQAIEATNNETRLQNPSTTPVNISPQPVHRDGPTNTSSSELSTHIKSRPKKLPNITEANNETKLHRRSSWGDQSSPSPAKNRTQLMECKRMEETNKASEKYESIRRQCIQTREHFVDPEFPPCDKSLYIDPRKPVSHWQVAAWRRPRDIVDPFSNRKTTWSVLRNDPDPGAIAQGVLGNCWVLSALSVIASVPELVERILLTRDYSHAVGAYQVRLCKDGVWTTVVVDDSLPVFRNRELVFSKAHHKQLWVPLIEKAIAKLYGSYESLNSGRVLAGLSLLTGLPCEKIHLKKQSDGDEEVDQDLIWAQLLSFKQAGFPMGASCGGYNICNEDYYRVGLEPNHAYSILDVLPLDLDGHTFRLLRLRNPWAKVSWTGDWSDGDSVWSHYPRLRDEKMPLGGEVGIFWIELADVYRYFCEIDVCQYRPQWHSTLMQSNLPSSAPNQHSLLSFQIPVNTEVNVCVYQEAPRGGSDKGHNLLDLAALVLRYPIAEASSSIPFPVSCSLVVGSQIQSIVSGSGFLEPGSYAVLPLAFNHWRPQDTGTEERAATAGGMVEERASTDRACVVSVFSSRMISYDDHVMTRPGFLAESLFLLATNMKPKSEPYPGMRIYEVCLRHGCRIIMAFNQSQHLHFTVSCNARESQNILCTRGALHTTDCIPPMHRQVLLVLTQMEPSEPYSIYMRIEFQHSTRNTSGTWGALHQPLLTPSIHELHSPRLC